MYKAWIFTTIFCLSQPLFAQEAGSDCVKNSSGNQICVGQSVYMPRNYTRLSDADYAGVANTDWDRESYFRAYRAKADKIEPYYKFAFFNGFGITQTCNNWEFDGRFAVVAGIMKNENVTVKYACNDHDLGFQYGGEYHSVDTKPDSLLPESNCSASGLKTGDFVTTVEMFEGFESLRVGQVAQCFSGGAIVGFFKKMYNTDWLLCLSIGGTNCANAGDSSRNINLELGRNNYYSKFIKNQDLQKFVKSVKELGGFRVGDVVDYVDPIEPCERPASALGRVRCHAYEPWTKSKKVIVRLIFSDGTFIVADAGYKMFEVRSWAATAAQLKK